MVENVVTYSRTIAYSVKFSNSVDTCAYSSTQGEEGRRLFVYEVVRTVHNDVHVYASIIKQERDRN